MAAESANKHRERRSKGEWDWSGGCVSCERRQLALGEMRAAAAGRLEREGSGRMHKTCSQSTQTGRSISSHSQSVHLPRVCCPRASGFKLSEAGAVAALGGRLACKTGLFGRRRTPKRRVECIPRRARQTVDAQKSGARTALLGSARRALCIEPCRSSLSANRWLAKTAALPHAERDREAAGGTPGTRMASLCAQKSGASGCVFLRLIACVLVQLLSGDRISPLKILCNVATNPSVAIAAAGKEHCQGSQRR